jgi:hypothetical protein
LTDGEVRHPSDCQKAEQKKRNSLHRLSLLFVPLKHRIGEQQNSIVDVGGHHISDQRDHDVVIVVDRGIDDIVA